MRTQTLGGRDDTVHVALNCSKPVCVATPFRPPPPLHPASRVRRRWHSIKVCYTLYLANTLPTFVDVLSLQPQQPAEPHGWNARKNLHFVEVAHDYPFPRAQRRTSSVAIGQAENGYAQKPPAFNLRKYGFSDRVTSGVINYKQEQARRS